MSEQEFGSIPPGSAGEPAAAGSEPAWEAVPQTPPPGASYAQQPPPPPGYAPPPPGYAPPPPGYAPPPPGYAPPGAGYAPPPPGYAPPGYQHYAPPPPGYVPPPAAAGLSDNAAGALAYVTIIPAIIFLVLAPYNQKPFVKFHAIQELGLFVIAVCLHLVLVVPILGLVVYSVGWACLVVLWAICIIKASQGGAFKLPGIGDFAAQQSGYTV